MAIGQTIARVGKYALRGAVPGFGLGMAFGAANADRDENAVKKGFNWGSNSAIGGALAGAFIGAGGHKLPYGKFLKKLLFVPKIKDFSQYSVLGAAYGGIPGFVAGAASSDSGDRLKNAIYGGVTGTLGGLAIGGRLGRNSKYKLSTVLSKKHKAAVRANKFADKMMHSNKLIEYLDAHPRAAKALQQYNKPGQGTLKQLKSVIADENRRPMDLYYKAKIKPIMTGSSILGVGAGLSAGLTDED